MPNLLLAPFLLLLALFLGPPALAYSIDVPDFKRLERELRIRPSQKAQYDAAVEASQRALMSVAIAGLTVKERLAQEFAKPLPDLNAIYRANEEALSLTLPNFRDARDEWERLYTLMDRRQVDAARRFIEEHFSKFWR